MPCWPSSLAHTYLTWLVCVAVLVNLAMARLCFILALNDSVKRCITAFVNASSGSPDLSAGRLRSTRKAYMRVWHTSDLVIVFLRAVKYSLMYGPLCSSVGSPSKWLLLCNLRLVFIGCLVIMMLSGLLWLCVLYSMWWGVGYIGIKIKCVLSI